MTTNEVIESAIQGHASTRDAIRWAIQQEREACAKLVEADANARGKGGGGLVLLRLQSVSEQGGEK